MYEDYYGLAEKPFSLTPDPKYLYRSQSHANAFELLQYAIERREGFVVVTGDIGTGKTTLCRALLEQIDRNTFTALVLNPFLSEEDLLKRILQDFGVISRDDLKAGRTAGVTKQDMIDTLYEFLLGLVPLKAGAVLVIDEAQNLPHHVLEQIRILSNLETDKEKLLQIILVGQLNLRTLLRSPELRQLDQRVSIRYELQPLDEETVAAYVAHRLTIAGGSAAVAFTAKALAQVHRLSGGVPRLINLICDRALLAGFSLRASRITPEMVRHAAESLDLPSAALPRAKWLTRRAPLPVGAAVVLLGAALAVGASALLYERLEMDALEASTTPSTAAVPERIGVPVASDTHLPSAAPNRRLPRDAALTILVGSYPWPDGDSEIRSVTAWLEATGYHVYYVQVDLGSQGIWRRVLAGAYTDPNVAQVEVARMNAAAPALEARIVTSAMARGAETRQ